MDVVFQPLQCGSDTLGPHLGIGIHLFWEQPPRHSPEDTSIHKPLDKSIFGPSTHTPLTPEHSHLLRPWTLDGCDSIWNSEVDREIHERSL